MRNDGGNGVPLDELSSSEALAANGSAEPDECETPPSLVETLARRYGQFTWDVAASQANSVVPGRFWDKARDALQRDWLWSEKQVIWCNPPYSRGNKPAFLRRARNMVEWSQLHKAICLVPANTAEDWFQDLVFRGADCIGSESLRRGKHTGTLFRLTAQHCRIDLIFLSGRLRFRNPTMPSCKYDSPHSSVVVAYQPRRL